MAATRDQIPTDLTMEIGDAPSPEQFIRAASAFFGYVREVSAATANSGAAPGWVVKVREGSALLALAPDTEFPTEAHKNALALAAKGVRAAAAGRIAETGLPDMAFDYLTKLSELTQAPKVRPTSIRLWIEKEPTILDATIAALIHEEEQLGYRDYGTVEGIMDTVQDRQGKLRFRIRDAALGVTIMCDIREAQLEEAFKTFRKRVEVSGVIHYRRDGRPVRIKVDHIEMLPSDEDLPQPEEVLGILRITA